MEILEIFKAILFGIVEGITEWLPISSTGHLILVDEFLHLKASDAFKEMFNDKSGLSTKPFIKPKYSGNKSAERKQIIRLGPYMTISSPR